MLSSLSSSASACSAGTLVFDVDGKLVKVGLVTSSAIFFHMLSSLSSSACACSAGTLEFDVDGKLVKVGLVTSSSDDIFTGGSVNRIVGLQLSLSSVSSVSSSCVIFLVTVTLLLGLNRGDNEAGGLLMSGNDSSSEIYRTGFYLYFSDW